MTLTDVISPFMGQARWFTGSSSTPDVQIVDSIDIGGNVIIHLVAADDTLFSVPLSYGVSADDPAVIGEVDGILVADATDTHTGQLALLGAVLGDFASASRSLDTTPIRGNTLPEIAEATKLRSEQSNTSIIYRFSEPDDGAVGIILKIFRVLSPGRNPDVELQQALDYAGAAVPRQYGCARWADYDIAVAQEFLDGSRDAWQVMTDALQASTRLTNRADIVGLGQMTREIHEALADAFPVVDASADQRRALRESWSARARRAIADARELAPYASAIDAVFDRALQDDWPRLQRIHGDYHLGQVLNSPARGWIALDFEGEPLRPLTERVTPDLALRDVAGMLRSFDYAAGAAGKNGGEATELATWASEAKSAFMSGYGTVAANDLLFALTLDKALYEVSYEAASRPTWIDIPLAGVRSLLDQANRSESTQNMEE